MGKLLFIAFILLLNPNLNAQIPFQRNIPFDDNWWFLKGGMVGAEKPEFNDSA